MGARRLARTGVGGERDLRVGVPRGVEVEAAARRRSSFPTGGTARDGGEAAVATLDHWNLEGNDRGGEPPSAHAH
jgi:hypothetical protein